MNQKLFISFFFKTKKTTLLSWEAFIYLVLMSEVKYEQSHVIQALSKFKLKTKKHLKCHFKLNLNDFSKKN